MKNIRGNLTDKVYPDYCLGFIYTMLAETGLGRDCNIKYYYHSLDVFQLLHKPQWSLQKNSVLKSTWRIAWSQESSGRRSPRCPSRNGDWNFSHFVPNVVFCLQSLAGPTCVGELWDNYLSHCPFLCIIRNMFNPLVLEASSAGDPEFQYVHNFKFLFCIFSEILVYEHLEPFLGNVDFILPRMCNRNSWYWNWIINLLIMTYNLPVPLLSLVKFVFSCRDLWWKLWWYFKNGINWLEQKRRKMFISRIGYFSSQ